MSTSARLAGQRFVPWLVTALVAAAFLGGGASPASTSRTEPELGLEPLPLVFGRLRYRPGLVARRAAENLEPQCRRANFQPRCHSRVLRGRDGSGRRPPSRIQAGGGRTIGLHRPPPRPRRLHGPRSAKDLEPFRREELNTMAAHNARITHGRSMRASSAFRDGGQCSCRPGGPLPNATGTVAPGAGPTALPCGAPRDGFGCRVGRPEGRE